MPHYRGRVPSTSVPERFRPLQDATAELAERFRQAGHRLYLVGGSVRDALFPVGAAPDADFELAHAKHTGNRSRCMPYILSYHGQIYIAPSFRNI